jgi:hypothetical protein
MSDAGAPVDARRVAAVLDAVYAWSQGQGWRGHNKHDALNSPILRALLGWGRWPRILAIQLVTRAPVNPRALLRVPKTYNPKGLALFTHGLLDRFRAGGDERHLAGARDLLRLLLELRARGPWSGGAWGYAYPWQDLGFYAPAHTPNAVVTSFVCEAFLEAYRVTGERAYLDTVGEAIPFFLRDLPVLKDEPQELCLAYMPVPMRMRVLDVSILVGAVLAQHAALSGADTWRETAARLVRYVARRQTEYGAWYYTDPPGDSPVRHDNYHTGFILDALWRHMQATGEAEHRAAYDEGLRFYRERLFMPEGAPRWMSDVQYPYDVHGAAQGILTFARHCPHRDFAWRIAGWTLDHLYHPEGRFYYQRTRWHTKRFTLLRWCNAWMARALSRLLVEGGGP